MQEGLNIVIPFYNESDSLEKLCTRLSQVRKKLQREMHVIFIDDGSTDNGFELLQKSIPQYHELHIKIIRFRRNFGKTAALSAGFSQVKQPLVLTMDADLQDSPEEITNLLKVLEEGNYDLVSGWKQKRNDPLNKTFPSKVFNQTMRFLTGLKIHDINCGLKLYRKAVVEHLNLYGELHRFIPYLATLKGFHVGECAVHHEPRRFGKSKYNAMRFISGFFDAITLLFISRFRRKPLHFFGSIGLALSSIGFLIDLYLSILWCMGSVIGNRPLLILGVLLIVVGIQFISMGLIAELLTHESGKKDDYVIEEIVT